jgi:hypothetical protein
MRIEIFWMTNDMFSHEIACMEVQKHENDDSTIQERFLEFKKSRKFNSYGWIKYLQKPC